MGTGLKKSIAAAAISLGVGLLVSACGGGGSSSSPQPTMSVSPQTLINSATTTTVNAPSSTVVVSVANPPSAQLYVAYKDTSNGIATVNLQAVSNSTEDVQIIFKDPSILGVGKFSDTLEVAVCTDSQCNTPIAGSPQQVSVQYTITQGNPALVSPTVLSLSPATAVEGGAGLTLTVNGQNFEPQSVVEWNGIAQPTTYNSPTQVSAQISAGDFTNPGSLVVSVSNQATGGSNSTGLNFTVTPAPPSVSSLSPSSADVGGEAFVLTVDGSYFDSGASVLLNGTPLTTTFVSASQLTAQVPASALSTAGALDIDVSSSITGLTSNTQTLSVGYAPLTLGSLSPPSVTAGGPSFELSVFGTGFTQGSTVQWNGSARTTTIVSPTEILAQVSSTDIASSGSATVDVVNTAANPGMSTDATLTIAARTTDAVAYRIDAHQSGTNQFANIVAPGALPSTPTWSVNIGQAASTPLIVGGKVFVVVNPSGQAINQLYALNLADGSVAWGPVVLPWGGLGTAYDAGRIFISIDSTQNTDESTGELQSYDAATGALQWSANTTQPFVDVPVAADGLVFVNGYGDGSAIFVFTEAGTPVWNVQSNGSSTVLAATADGVYATYPCLTYDFRPSTGETIWMQRTAGCLNFGTNVSVVVGGLLYSPTGPGSTDGTVFNAETGAATGQTYLSQSAPAIGSQVSYFLQGQNGTLVAVSNSTGNTLWSFTGDGTLFTAPVLVNNYLFIGGNSGQLYMLDATTGAQLRSVNLATFIAQSSGVTAGDGVLIVPAGDTINAFTLSTNP
jgi:outer membrane protein assembly factor BamB